VPSDAFVALRSSDGILRTQGLRGDVILESATGAIEATDLSNAYLYVKTLSGTVLLANIRSSHLNVRSIKGNVNLRNVTSSSVEVHSGTGRIAYEGDPGRMGQYLLASHTGDLEISIPASAAADIRARSEKGQLDPDLEGSRGGSSAIQRNLLLRGEPIAHPVLCCARSRAIFRSNDLKVGEPRIAETLFQAVLRISRITLDC
jgi:hypothetical protein